jgi:hypothetical protein
VKHKHASNGNISPARSAKAKPNTSSSSSQNKKDLKSYTGQDDKSIVSAGSSQVSASKKKSQIIDDSLAWIKREQDRTKQQPHTNAYGGGGGGGGGGYTASRKKGRQDGDDDDGSRSVASSLISWSTIGQESVKPSPPTISESGSNSKKLTPSPSSSGIKAKKAPIPSSSSDKQDIRHHLTKKVVPSAMDLNLSHPRNTNVGGPAKEEASASTRSTITCTSTSPSVLGKHKSSSSKQERRSSFGSVSSAAWGGGSSDGAGRAVKKKGDALNGSFHGGRVRLSRAKHRQQDRQYKGFQQTNVTAGTVDRGASCSLLADYAASTSHSNNKHSAINGAGQVGNPYADFQKSNSSACFAGAKSKSSGQNSSSSCPVTSVDIGYQSDASGVSGSSAAASKARQKRNALPPPNYGKDGHVQGSFRASSTDTDNESITISDTQQRRKARRRSSWERRRTRHSVRRLSSKRTKTALRQPSETTKLDESEADGPLSKSSDGSIAERSRRRRRNDERHRRMANNSRDVSRRSNGLSSRQKSSRKIPSRDSNDRNNHLDKTNKMKREYRKRLCLVMTLSSLVIGGLIIAYVLLSRDKDPNAGNRKSIDTCQFEVHVVCFLLHHGLFILCAIEDV